MGQIDPKGDVHVLDYLVESEETQKTKSTAAAAREGNVSPLLGNFRNRIIEIYQNGQNIIGPIKTHGPISFLAI